MSPAGTQAMTARAVSRAALNAGVLGELTLVVYQWRGWDGFLINRIAPGAMMIEASPDDEVDRLIDRLPRTPGVFLFHLNCSITDKFPFQRKGLITALRDLGWVLCNEEVVDISKRGIQARLATAGCRSVSPTPDGSAHDLMVLKSNYNHGGMTERELPKNIRGALGLDHLPPLWLDAAGYRTVARSALAPEWWDDLSVAIERFEGNERGYYYRVSLAGQHAHLVQLHCPDSIKKVGRSRVVRTWNSRFDAPSSLSDPVADEVLAEAIRASVALDMDFGTMDVVLNDLNEPFVVDVNTTPWFPGWVKTDFPDYIRHLSGGAVTDKSSRRLIRALLRRLRIESRCLSSEPSSGDGAT